MADGAPAAPAASPAPAAAPAPSGGAGGPPAPSRAPAGNGASTRDPLPPTGSAGPTRGPDGKFTGKPGEPAPEAPVKSARDRLLERVDEDGNVVLKVHGKPTKMPWDQALAELEIGQGGKARFAEVDKRERALKEREERYDKDPLEYFKDRNLDPMQFIERHLQTQLQQAEQQAAMTPEQRAEAALAGERAKLQAEQDEWRQHQETAQEQAANEETGRLLMEHVPQAFQAAGLPEVPEVIDTFKVELSRVLESGQPLTPEVIKYAAQATRDGARTMVRHFTGTLKGKALADELGPEVVNELRRYELEEFRRAQNGGNLPPPPKVSGEPRPVKGPYLSEREWKRQEREAGRG